MTTSRPASGDSPVVALAALILTLAVVNVARSTIVPGGAHLVFNIGVGLAVTVFGVAVCGLRTSSLGLSRERVTAGLGLGGAVFLTVAAATMLTASIPAGREALDVDDAYVTAGALLWRIGVMIPLGTVLVEEVIFRGVLHGLLLRVWSPARAWVTGATLFGLWHVFPAWRAEGFLLAAGTFVATTVAGAVFVWLRVRSDSLVAPLLAHLATNTVPLNVAWVLAGGGR